MNDKQIMENILLTTKGAIDLYMHGTIESSTGNVHQTFSTALNNTLCMQDEIYKKMAAKGWYPMEKAWCTLPVEDSMVPCIYRSQAPFVVSRMFSMICLSSMFCPVPPQTRE